jgi:hypothetical protein
MVIVGKLVQTLDTLNCSLLASVMVCGKLVSPMDVRRTV